MEVNREKMLEFLRQATELDYQRIFFAEPRPLPLPGTYGNCTQRISRFILPLTRDKRIRFAENGELKDRVFIPGEVLFCRPFGWSTEVWDREHSMVSVVLRERTIRTLFISHNGLPPDQDGPDVFYHTASPLSTAGTHLLQAILTGSGEMPSTLLSFRALLAMVVEALEHDSGASFSKEAFTWDCVQDYMEANFFRDISRESIARTMRIHPAHLSRLVRKLAGCGVNEYLTRLRMERAVTLLEDGTLTVDEIADQCGYTYTSYFIRVFRQYFAESPARYREKRHQEQL